MMWICVDPELLYGLALALRLFSLNFEPEVDTMESLLSANHLRPKLHNLVVSLQRERGWCSTSYILQRIRARERRPHDRRTSQHHEEKPVWYTSLAWGSEIPWVENTVGCKSFAECG